MRFIGSVICICSAVLSIAQNNDSIYTGALCSYYGEKLETKLVTFAGADDATKIIERIINVIGLKPRFEIRAADVPNAAAVIHQNRRYVLYNPKFIKTLNRSAGSEWASVSILAHEIGHHLNGHTLDEGGSRPDIELEADEFSGFVLRRMGASLDEAQVAMKIAADVKASHTHPAKADRLASISRGWHNAGAAISNKEESPAKQQDAEQPVVLGSPEPSDQSILAEKFIALKIRFNADPGGEYFVTIRNNFVKIHDNQIYIIGRLGESNKKEFPLMLYDDHYNYMYLDKKGIIYNGRNKKVGRVIATK